MFSPLASIIFPGSATQGRREAMVHPAPGQELLPLTARDGTKIAALLAMGQDPGGPAPRGQDRPTVLFFYGNAMCLAHCGDLLDELRPLGFNVVIGDYPGYGMSDGRPSEAGCYAAADALYEHVLGRADIDRGKIVAAGWSLGAAVAIDLASRRRVAGLAAFSAFTSSAALARRIVPWLPVSLLLRGQFDSLTKIAKVSCPIMLVHGGRDELIPARMSDRLAQAATTRVFRIRVDDAGHNDLFAIGGARLMQQFKQFVDQL
ncbi:MAG: alpha/beta hydrolase [Tepidisphaeraceae bacterium]|jgi:pimeloyl-ACP methyl ester carboxylesterase